MLPVELADDREFHKTLSEAMYPQLLPPKTKEGKE